MADSLRVAHHGRNHERFWWRATRCRKKKLIQKTISRRNPPQILIHSQEFCHPSKNLRLDLTRRKTGRSPHKILIEAVPKRNSHTVRITHFQPFENIKTAALRINMKSVLAVAVALSVVAQVSATTADHEVSKTSSKNGIRRRFLSQC